jgi:putative spermidine/putrescine transport system permease protein
MRLSKRAKLLLRAGVGLTLAFIYLPLLVIAVYAFSSAHILEWPPPGFTLHWFDKAFTEAGPRDALWTSVKVGIGATAVAILLGTLASLAVARHRFFGRETISFLVILPIALPGVVTGVALNDTFTQVVGISLSLLTVVIAHATFCIVVVYNNVVARLRRTSGAVEEASADLGAGPFQTFRNVTLPSMRTALAAGALLAFALSFDEIIVTYFTIGGQETLPIWIFNILFRGTPSQLPVVNAVAVVVVILSIIPVYLAHRLTRDEEGVATVRGGPTAETAAAP